MGVINTNDRSVGACRDVPDSLGRSNLHVLHYQNHEARLPSRLLVGTYARIRIPDMVLRTYLTSRVPRAGGLRFSISDCNPALLWSLAPFLSSRQARNIHPPTIVTTTTYLLCTRFVLSHIFPGNSIILIAIAITIVIVICAIVLLS